MRLCFNRTTQRRGRRRRWKPQSEEPHHARNFFFFGKNFSLWIAAQTKLPNWFVVFSGKNKNKQIIIMIWVFDDLDAHIVRKTTCARVESKKRSDSQTTECYFNSVYSFTLTYCPYSFIHILNNKIWNIRCNRNLLLLPSCSWTATFYRPNLESVHNLSYKWMCHSLAHRTNERLHAQDNWLESSDCRRLKASPKIS